MRHWVKESEKRLSVTGEYDVLVVGGGIAGVAAALSAARSEARVALVEKECALGGLATLGNVVIYLSLCDGMGHQVIKGLGEELLKTSIKDGYAQIPNCWTRRGDRRQRSRHRYRVRFNPASFILALEELVLRNNVDMYYDTRFCDIVKRGDHLNAIIVENKDGRSAIACRTVVDASGDADVCARAGEPTVSLGTNSRSGWFFYWSGQELKLEPLYKPYDPYGKLVPSSGAGYAGDKADDVTKYVVDTRALIRQRLKKLKRTTDVKFAYPALLPTIPTFRMTRRLKGEFELNESDERQIFPDSVGMTGDWRQAGPVYYIPLRALIGVKTANLITAGRCISSGTIWDVTRAIPTCAVTGQAAGTAAVLASRMKSPRFSRIDTRTLQKQLRKQSVLVNKRIPLPPITKKEPEQYAEGDAVDRAP